MTDNSKVDHLIIDIPEMSLDYNDKSWTENIKAEFDQLQAVFAPGKSGYSYYTWFWFFMKYGDFLFSEEAQNKIDELGNIFDFMKDCLGLDTTAGGAYTIGYKFFKDFLQSKQTLDVCGIQFRRSMQTQKDSAGIKKSLQVIYYGAPGTGKSHTIQQLTNDSNSVRITFHPDSDYSSFVGAYKPTMTHVPVYATYGNTAQEVKLNGEPLVENKIQYEFIPQAFLTAYVEAWRRMAKVVGTEEKPEDYYLVIEEINRGNCAQIFGDLFQLLDRKANGYSSYCIKPDKDIQKFLASNEDGFANPDDFPEGSIPEKIRNGQQMVLPPNLHIWATMNTSDQSLFPIDSAFKRRWDWKYIPISKGIDKSTGKELNWVIRAGGYDWDWWNFLEKINPVIYSATQSEDKKLGFFFAHAYNNVISADQFVGKVIFYIWNDVLKDFGLDREEFTDKSVQDGDNDRLTFDKFFMPDGKPNEDAIVMFLNNLGVNSTETDDIDLLSADSDTISGTFTRKHIKVTMPDGTIFENNNSTTTLIEVIEFIGPTRVYELGLKASGREFISKNLFETDEGGYRSAQKELTNGYFLSSKNSTEIKITLLQEISKKLGLNMTVELINPYE